MLEKRPKRRILVYETVISFLKEACSTRVLGRNASEISEAQDTLDDYSTSLAFDNVVSGIVESLGYRKKLIELASELGLANDIMFGAALQRDGEQIALLLMSIFTSDSQKESALRLKGNSAQCFLDMVQSVYTG
ncbi:hypothetical protein K438DRAFT_1133119 [Mycena galopus ATCC 62051]|nr:hypothetical protein K438DRAFT_849079 [Mycena galopus ATCC 62051]KAF8183848.1 hypothetical protein K438DRAFT_1133119 [Mycena galopus ATCC 62051]